MAYKLCIKQLVKFIQHEHQSTFVKDHNTNITKLCIHLICKALTHGDIKKYLSLYVIDAKVTLQNI